MKILCWSLILAAGPIFAVDAACQAPLDAIYKQAKVPMHIYSEAAGTGGKTQKSEVIYTSDATYIQVAGVWKKSPGARRNAEEIRQDSSEKLSKTTCKRAREEALNGEAADVYIAHSSDDDEKVDTTIWVSKSRGLPLREDVDIIEVGGSAGKSHRSIRYEYSNVQAPAGH